MQMDWLNIGLGFLEGLALIVSPCILPILPFILAGSLEGSKRRPYGIVFGFVLIFALFTFFSRALVQSTGIDLTVVKNISYLLLLFFGIIMLSTYLTEKFSYYTQRLANTGSSLSIINSPQSGFWGGVLFGGLIAIIWTPCAGPILAAVIVQSVLQKTSFDSFLVVLAFGLGAAIPMLLIVLFGRAVMNKLNFAKTHAVLIRQILGAIIIVSVVYMFEGGIYRPTAVKPFTTEIAGTELIEGLTLPYVAPEIAGITEWINSKPLQLSELKGKVVLIDFWTYSCINCIRTLPYLKDWYAKYHDNGLEIIGVHSPEFEFEKNPENVKKAVEQDGIKYPVALDNNFVTWQNYQNRYWPAHYLIDKEGRVVYQHFGEGAYDITENNIRYLLGMHEPVVPTKITAEENGVQTPETYLGYLREQTYAGIPDLLHNTIENYTYPETLAKNTWALSGAWKVTQQFVVSAKPNAAVKINFRARKVFVVMGNAAGFPITVKVKLDGKEVKTLQVSQNKLYEAVSLAANSKGILELVSSAPGLEIYTFTFG